MDAFQRKKIESVIQDIHHLPTLPVIYSRLKKLLADPRSTAKEIGAMLEEDQALTTRILKIVNSALFSFPKRISSVPHAVVILGIKEIKHITLAASVVDLFPEVGSTYNFNHKAFWEHSLAVAACSRIIAKKVGIMKVKDPEEAFTAGLIHDIGKLISDQFMHDTFIKVLKTTAEEQIPYIQAEEKNIGFTHQDIGRFLAEKWNLPLPFIEIISYHNTPILKNIDGTIFVLLAIVHLANILAKALNIGFSGDPFVTPLDELCWKALGINENQIQLIMDETKENSQELIELLLTANA